MKNLVFILLSSAMLVTAGTIGDYGINVSGTIPKTAPATAACTNELVTSYPASNIRNDAYWLGFAFTCISNITVCQLQRLALSGDTNSHTILICDATHTLVSGSVSMLGVPAGTFASVSVADTLLLAGTNYVLAVDELNGDPWLSAAQTNLISSSLITPLGSAFVNAGNPHNVYGNYSVNAGYASFSTPDATFH